MPESPSDFAVPLRAWVRPVPDRFADALRAELVPLDLDCARTQHAAYVAALEAAGVEVVELPAMDAQPDSVFVEDPVVLMGDRVLEARSSAPSRAVEAFALARAIAGGGVVVELVEPGATLDGGDVLRFAGGMAVGLSRRSNPAGARSLATLAAADGLRVVPIAVARGLHLKSAVTLATPGLAVVDPSAVDPADVAALGLEVLEVDEPLGANVLCLGAHTLVSASAPRTAALLRARGLEVVELELSELHKADGALTCCSVRQAPPGRWCT